ncbi:MAG: ABC transporter permease [Actinomycetota bacterium]|nr:ABC transporter permease [Actinomycetota bacterium]
MSSAGLVMRQARFENKAFWRNPAAAFFTFAFPLLFLVIFSTLLGGGTSTSPTGEEIESTTYFIPAILSFAVITACFTNIAIGISFSRDEGVLKRIRGTPCPGWVYLAGRVLHATFITLILVVIVLLFGLVFYGVEIPFETLPAFFLTLIVGAAAFCALGLAATCAVPNAEAAPAVVNVMILPLLFLSGTFFPIADAPGWIKTVAGIFPVKHFLDATFESFLPPPDNLSGLLWTSIAVIAAWGIGGLLIAARFFRWEPNK